MLSAFKTQDTLQGALSLFESLGIKLNVYTEEPADISTYLPDVPKTVSDIFPKIARCWFVGTIDDATLRGEDEAVDFDTEVSRIDEHYKGMVVFAIDVAEGESLTRTEISAITRAFNRRSKAAPVALIVHRDDYISFAICERTPWVRSDKTGEKPGKVLLLRNIYLPHPHRGHIDILRRMEVGDAMTFDDLYKQWMQVFDSDTLTDLFYKELQNWFFWAIKNVTFPNDVNNLADDEKYNPENVIRLITRLVFVWFLLHKGLIPKEIFNLKYLKTILKNFDAESKTSSQYYHAILQNLFFATLNRKIDERSFVDKKEYWINRFQGKFEIKTFFRHADELLISKEEFIELLHGVPFINNSLFECLDGKESGGKTYNWDGFSNSKKPQRQCVVPNKLFFAEEEVVDLSEEYERVTAKQTKVHGLINILKSFNFTVEENTPLDVDVALDPELLGKAFENLLALFNPETGKTVRKSTGSYYTPRPIVQYMVDESIVSYLLKAVPDVPETVTREILGYGELPQLSLTDDQHRRLVEAVYNCRMLDPACGSGAFPMGILQQLSHLLSRIDTDNRYWEETVMRRAMDDIEKASHLNEADREATKADIQTVFNMSVNFPDYARKLYLIENCIYGVDIQTIAVQISRLRFFISLICEQQPSKDAADNYGIRPLPNLEMKFVAANTLVRLADADDAHLLFQDDKIKALIEQLRQVRHQLFIVTDNHKKTEYLKKDRKLREKIAELSADNFADERQAEIDDLEKRLAEEQQKLLFAKENLPETFETIQITNLFGEVVEQRKENVRDRKLKEMTQTISNIKAEIKRLTDTADAGRASTLALARQLTDWNPYDQNVSSPFFDPDWMFGIKNGFDIVIGNPPYVRRTTLQDSDKNYYETEYFSAYKQYDLYLLFIERGIKLLAKDACLCFINPIKFLVSDYGLKSREFILKNAMLKFIVDVSQIDVFDASAYPCIITITNKIEPNAKFYFDGFNSVNDTYPSSSFTKCRTLSSILEDKYYRIILNDNVKHNSLICHIERVSETLSSYFDNQRGLANTLVNFNGTAYTGIKSTNVEHYVLNGELPKVSVSDIKANLFIPEMVILPRTVKDVKAAIKPPHYIVLDRIYYLIPNSEIFDNAYIVGILNSKLLNFWFEYYFASEKVRGGYFDLKGPQIKEIPIVKQNAELQSQIANLVRNIIFTNKFDNVPLIDKFVYQIYGLTYDEVLVVDPQPPFSREEYESHS